MATPGPSRRKRNTKPSVPSDSDDELVLNEPISLVDQQESIDKIRESVQSFSDMTDEEMLKHMNLCVKLSAENKINAKNAFGLHLIGIMQKIVNKGKIDFQQASLSLQASSKIYAGRVDALYQDMVKFQGHLSSIVTGGKKDKISKNEDEVMCDDELVMPKSKAKSKCKSFLKAEESLRLQEVTTSSSIVPHGNFITINSAFSTSRLAPRLLSGLQTVDDSCMLRCAIPEPCFKPKAALNNKSFPVAPKLKVLLEKIKNFDVAQSGFQVPSTVPHTPFKNYISTPKPVSASRLFDDDEVNLFAPPDDLPAMPDPADEMPAPADDVNSVESAIDRFDVLNITVDVFLNDIAGAVTDRGVVDQRLLPPNSTVKKMLDKSKRSSIRPPIGKTPRIKVKEPFFDGKSAADVKHLFIKGKSTTLSKKTLEEWNKKENVTITDSGYELLEALESNKDQERSSYDISQRLLEVVENHVPHLSFKYYFNKQSQGWKFSRKKFCMNESLASTPNRDQSVRFRQEIDEEPGEPENLALSFQKLSLEPMQEIPAESSSFCEPPPLNESDIEDQQFVMASDPVDEGEQQFVVPSDSFDLDIEDLMVKPPELVRPAKMKFDEKPVNLDMDKMKDLLWSIISRSFAKNASENGEAFVMFSEAYKELKKKLEREISESISIQFAFVVLLILANQKTLFFQTIENADLKISQDISEIDVSHNM